jgi:ubiquinone/menaquinone biosynthesis C-methylase UbiE
MASRIPRSAERVLDVGCGDGTFCRFVAREDRLVVGVDSDESVLPEACRGQNYAVTSADALALAEDSFDAVTMSMVLHHVDAQRGVVEALRVLAPGGVLLILGMGRFGGVRDIPAELRDLATHRTMSRRMQVWEPPTVKAEPSQTWADVRSFAHRALPGCAYRRLPMWRYLIEYEKPARRI